MIDFKDYFDPVSIESPDFKLIADQSGFPHNITVHTQNLSFKT